MAASLVEAINDCFHVELERDDDVMVMGEDVGRAAESSARPQDCSTGSAEPLRRHAAGRSRDHGHGRRALHGRLASCKCPVRRVLVSGARPADHARRAVPLADRRRYVVPARGADAVPAAACAPELHDDSPETYYVHTPGVKVAIPSTPADAKGCSPRRSAATTRWSCSSRSCTTARCAGGSGRRARRRLGSARVACEGTTCR